MAQIVTATCSHCNAEVKLRPEGVHVFLYTTKWPNDYYAFFCPHCKAYVQKDADEHCVSLLAGVSVPRTVIQVPLEVIERKAWKTCLTSDDLLNLMDYLNHNDTMPDLRRAARK